MAISFTLHGGDHNAPTPEALRKPSTDRVDVADAAVSSALTIPGFYRIAASTTSYVAVGSAVTNGTNGAHFPAGHVEVWWIGAGDKIGCSAGV